MSNEPKFTISVSRQSKKFAVFEGHFKFVWGFHPFTVEAEAVMRAKAWIEEHYPGTDFNTEVRVVYPHISKITMSS